MNDSAKVSEHYILFVLADAAYAVRSNEVRQMEMVEQITPVPNAPPAVEGVVFVRGRVIPVLNLRVRFGFEKIAYDLRTRLIVVQSGERAVGLIVDAAREFVTIPAAAIEPPPDVISGLKGRFLTGIALVKDRLVLILNIDQVINPAETVIREEPTQNH